MDKFLEAFLAISMLFMGMWFLCFGIPMICQYYVDKERNKK